MPELSRPWIALKALFELGPRPLLQNAVYRLGLRTGHYRRLELRIPPAPAGLLLRPLFPLPSREELLPLLGEEGKAALLAEAGQVVEGRVRLFGGEFAPLQLALPGELKHWSAYELHPEFLSSQLPDIKFLWEPARFGWVFLLGRAYHLTGNDVYAGAFWREFETFTASNPPYLGPHWVSAQEVALRLLAFTWASQVFTPSPASTPGRLASLAASVVRHAARIPHTLVYARSQGNNHLLSESAALLTASLALPEHPASPIWRKLGWKGFNLGLQAQVDGYGEYAQHSTNYHRLMLQLALWVQALLPKSGLRYPRRTLDALTRATHWLLALLDPDSGEVPNLGANDGAYLFSFTTCPFADFRPVAQSAAQAFLTYQLPAGPWDEMPLWFGIPPRLVKYVQLQRYLGDHLVSPHSWGYLRAVRLDTRPTHADQLHFDLWWRGRNVALDPGTYLYNAPPPWDNPLSSTLVHNTVTVDGREQMTRAGRFLYLDWASAYWKNFVDADEDILQRVRAHHYGYWRRGIRHERRLILHVGDRWGIEDELAFLPWLPFLHRSRLFRLHWLLPDWGWELGLLDSGLELRLASPSGPVRLAIRLEGLEGREPWRYSLARAGELLTGSGEVPPVRGWVAPTYGLKLPALSLAVELDSINDVKFISEFTFPT